MIILLSFLTLAFAAYWNLFRNKPMMISPETTVLTEPRTSDGRWIDYLKWYQSQEGIEPARIASDENGLRILVREFGTDDAFTVSEYTTLTNDEEREKYNNQLKEEKEKFYLALGLDVSVAPRRPLPDAEFNYDQYLEEKYPGPENQKIREDKAGKRPLTVFKKGLYQADPDAVQWWLDKNSSALDLAIQCFEKKVFHSGTSIIPTDQPPVTGLLFSNRALHIIRLLATSLKTKAELDLERGNISAAVSARIALYRLSEKLMNKQCFAIDYLIAFAFISFADDLEYGNNPEKQPSRNDWLRLGADCYSDQLEFDNYLKVMNNEILLSLDCIEYYLQDRRHRKISQENLSVYLPPSFWKLGFDWNIVLSEYNRRCRDELNSIGKNEKDPLPLIGETSDTEDRLFQYPLLKTFKTWTLKSRSEYLGRYIARDNIELLRSILPILKGQIRSKRILQISTALQLYRSDHGTYPPAFSTDKEGRPLHSWRVLILPYLEELEKERYRLNKYLREKPVDWELFKKIRLDEPWNSEYNRQFHSIIPKYFDLERNNGGGRTRFCVLIGQDALFNRSGKGVDPGALYKKEPERDVFSMILVAERADPICWMTPDFELDAEEIVRGISFTESEEGIEREILPASFYMDDLKFTYMTQVNGTVKRLGESWRDKFGLSKKITGRSEK